MSVPVCMLFARLLVVIVAAAVDIVVLIIDPPLPIKCVILVIDDISGCFCFQMSRTFGMLFARRLVVIAAAVIIVVFTAVSL